MSLPRRIHSDHVDLSISLEALERSRTQLPVSSYFDEDLFRASRSSSSSTAPRYRRARTRRARGRRLTTRCRRKAKAARWCARADGIELISNVCRHRQAVMLRAAASTRAATSSARCTAGPTTCTASLHRRAAFRPRPLPEPAQLPAAELERPAVRGTTARRRRRPGRSSAPRADARFQRLRASTARSCTSATTTGRPSSRSIWRTTTSARSTPAWAAS